MRIITIMIQEEGDSIDLKIIETGNGKSETDSEQKLSRKLMQIIHAPLSKLKELKVISQTNTEWKTAGIVLHLVDGSSLTWQVPEDKQRLATDYLSSQFGLPESNVV